MSQWRIPTVQKLEETSAPPAWVPLVLVLICVIAGAVFAVLDWKPGTPVSGKLAVNALLIPALFGGFVSAVFYIHPEFWAMKVEWWNARVAQHYLNWRYWSQWNLAIIDSVVITPEVDLAERMLGLEGKPPENAGATMTLDIAQSAETSRVEALIEQLVTPLFAQLERLQGNEPVSVILSAPSDGYLETLLNTLTRLAMPRLHASNLKFVASDQVGPLIDAFVNGKEWEWQGERKRPFEACLVVAFQLHEDDSAPSFTEAGVAMVMASMEVTNRYKFRPKARWFRPVTTTLDSLADRLEALLSAAPTPVEKLRHVWMSGLSKLGRNNVNGVLGDIEREWSRHELDQAIGLPGPVNPWLMQALAAQMVTYGQGPQLVFAPANDGVMVNLVAGPLSTIKEIGPPDMNFWPVSFVAMLSCMAGLLLAMVMTQNLSAVWGAGVLIGFAVLGFVCLPFAMLLHYRAVDDAFELEI